MIHQVKPFCVSLHFLGTLVGCSESSPEMRVMIHAKSSHFDRLSQFKPLDVARSLIAIQRTKDGTDKGCNYVLWCKTPFRVPNVTMFIFVKTWFGSTAMRNNTLLLQGRLCVVTWIAASNSSINISSSYIVILCLVRSNGSICLNKIAHNSTKSWIVIFLSCKDF
jgi:hypothetical protein